MYHHVHYARLSIRNTANTEFALELVVWPTFAAFSMRTSRTRQGITESLEYALEHAAADNRIAQKFLFFKVLFGGNLDLCSIKFSPCSEQIIKK